MFTKNFNGVINMIQNMIQVMIQIISTNVAFLILYYVETNFDGKHTDTQIAMHTHIALSKLGYFFFKKVKRTQ